LIYFGGRYYHPALSPLIPPRVVSCRTRRATGDPQVPQRGLGHSLVAAAPRPPPATASLKLNRDSLGIRTRVDMNGSGRTPSPPRLRPPISLRDRVPRSLCLRGRQRISRTASSSRSMRVP
jgi:hypothetical protein